jgi:hypothetical protein
MCAAISELTMRTTAQEFASFATITAADLTTVQGGCGKKKKQCCCPPPAPAPAPVAPPPGPQVSTSVSINYQ